MISLPRRRPRNVELVRALAASGITGRELAKAVSRHPGSISRLICLRTLPKESTAKAIADVLGVPAQCLFPRTVPDPHTMDAETGGDR